MTLHRPILRDEIRVQLAALCDETKSREDIATWALDIFDRHDISQLDAAARTVLDKMAMADLDDWDEPYLYGPEDFKTWAEELSGKNG